MAAPRLLTFHYTLRDAGGHVLDTSRGGEPTPFIESAGQIIEGLEESLRQMTVGETRAIVVPAEKAYGLREAELVQKVPKARLPVGDIKVGDQFQTGPDRQAPIVTIVSIEGDEVLLDANHPLAGQELHFEIELIAARPATPAELQQARNQS
jgi:FKBP-type peptidyl-prolyl cis-trans isomerase SlyD